VEGALGRFLGFWGVFRLAAFSIGGPEYVGLSLFGVYSQLKDLFRFPCALPKLSIQDIQFQKRFGGLKARMNGSSLTDYLLLVASFGVWLVCPPRITFAMTNLLFSFLHLWYSLRRDLDCIQRRRPSRRDC